MVAAQRENETRMARLKLEELGQVRFPGKRDRTDVLAREPPLLIRREAFSRHAFPTGLSTYTHCAVDALKREMEREKERRGQREGERDTGRWGGRASAFTVRRDDGFLFVEEIVLHARTCVPYI